MRRQVQGQISIWEYLKEPKRKTKTRQQFKRPFPRVGNQICLLDENGEPSFSPIGCVTRCRPRYDWSKEEKRNKNLFEILDYETNEYRRIDRRDETWRTMREAVEYWRERQRM